MAGEHDDVIIIRSGPRGGTVAWRLARTGKPILLVERGNCPSQSAEVNS